MFLPSDLGEYFFISLAVTVFLGLLSVAFVRRDSTLPVAIGSIVGILFLLLSGNVWTLAFSMLGASSIVLLYCKPGFLTTIAGFAVGAFILITGSDSYQWALFCVAFTVSAMGSLLVTNAIILSGGINNAMKGVDPRKESIRDVFQVSIGIGILIGSALVGLFYSRIAMLLGAVLLVAVGNVASTYPRAYLSRILWSMERESVILGLGAVWVAISAVLSAGLSHTIQAFLLCAVVIFVSDSMATIIGVRYGKTKLYRGSRKSLQGLVAHVLISVIAGYLLLGIAGGIIGVISSLVEGFSQGKLDDNLTTGVFVSVAVWLLPFL